MTLWKYTDLDRLHVYYKPERIIGEIVGVYDKFDGSCICLWKNSEGEIMISSRGQMKAARDLEACMKRTEEYEKVVSLLDDYPQYYVFGELIRKGKSPAQFFNYEKEEYIIFDMALTQLGDISLHKTYDVAAKYDIPTCPLVMTFTPSNLDELFKVNEELVELSQQKKLEGYVCKTLNGIHRWKVKSDLKVIPEKENKTKKIDPRPVLPDSEAFGAVEKARNDLTDEDFKDVKKAMPLVAKYIQREEEKHGCQKPRASYYYYYTTRLSQIFGGLNVSQINR